MKSPNFSLTGATAVATVSLSTSLMFLASPAHGSSVPQRTGIFCIGTSLEAAPNGAAPTLKPNEWLCDPANVSTRFGMNVIGMPQQYVNGRLVWQLTERGDALQLDTENINLGLYADGTKKWSTTCTAPSMGGSIVLTRGGNVMLLNGDNELAWVVDSNGEETLHKCIVDDDAKEEGEDKEKSFVRPGVPMEMVNEYDAADASNYAKVNEGGSKMVSEDDAVDTSDYAEANEGGSKMDDPVIGEPDAAVIVEDQIGTVDLTQHTCVGSEIAAGSALLPMEYICDPQNEGNRFGLSYFGMPTFYRNDVLIWWQDTTGDRLSFQEDGNLVLESNGFSAKVKWSSDCFDREEIGSDSFVGGNTLQFVGGEVKVYDNNAILVWRLDAAGDQRKCYPYGKTQTMNRANPFLCAGRAIGPDRHLEPHEFICDPADNGNRFGLSDNGFVELYHGNSLVWQTEETGNQLFFSYDTAELILREEGETKWSSGCTSDAVGKKVKYTPSGVKIIDLSDNLVWTMSHDGYPSTCFPVGKDQDDDDMDEDEVAMPENCKGYSLKVGEILGPNEFLCDPNDPNVKFGLSFVGMPQLLRGDQLLWFVPARGEKLVYHNDGHLVLYGEGQVKWSTKCYGKSRGRQIDFMQGSVNVLDEDWALIWKLDADGSGSECYPGFAAGSGGTTSGI